MSYFSRQLLHRYPGLRFTSSNSCLIRQFGCGHFACHAGRASGRDIESVHSEVRFCQKSHACGGAKVVVCGSIHQVNFPVVNCSLREYAMCFVEFRAFIVLWSPRRMVVWSASGWTCRRTIFRFGMHQITAHMRHFTVCEGSSPHGPQKHKNMRHSS